MTALLQMSRLQTTCRTNLRLCFQTLPNHTHIRKEHNTPSPITLVERARTKFPQSVAIVEGDGKSIKYVDLLRDSGALAKKILAAAGVSDMQDKCVCFLAPPTYEYVVMQWAIWRSGGIAVPMCTQHPKNELEYVLQDTRATLALAHPQYSADLSEAAKASGCKVQTVIQEAVDDNLDSGVGLPTAISPKRRAMMIYTSGTTGRPKGVVTTHDGLQAQICSLVEAWAWKPTDRIANVLPLHHVHGVVNVVACALWSGATCEMPVKLHPAEVWARFRSAGAPPLTLFMAVPTIYSRLIAAWDKLPPEEQMASTAAAAKLRLMVSGSAALPQPVFDRWQQVGGQTLLERYGMTEIGMALSNTLHARQPGCVGQPLPGVSVRIVDANEEEVPMGESGELRIKGQTVFQEYWGRPEATAKEFDADGWFKTGDVAAFDEACSSFQILGRASVDIIKSGGYKLSALDIERVLLEHEDIEECAVLGLDDEQWGQRVAAQVMLAAGSPPMTVETLRAWCSDRMAKYKAPSALKLTAAIPRNAMGKVNKKELLKNW